MPVTKKESAITVQLGAAKKDFEAAVNRYRQACPGLNVSKTRVARICITIWADVLKDMTDDELQESIMTDFRANIDKRGGLKCLSQSK